MKRLVMVVLLVVALTSAILLARSQPINSGQPGLTIRVLGAEINNKILGPRLVVLLCNDSRRSIFVQKRGLDRVTAWSQPLHAVVYDLQSGKEVYARTRPPDGPPAKPLRRSDFIELTRGCYGPAVDLRDEFIIKPGRKYKVQFTYSSLAPAKVGKIIPWKGKITSETVVIGVPKR